MKGWSLRYSKSCAGDLRDRAAFLHNHFFLHLTAAHFLQSRAHQCALLNRHALSAASACRDTQQCCMSCQRGNFGLRFVGSCSVESVRRGILVFFDCMPISAFPFSSTDRQEKPSFILKIPRHHPFSSKPLSPAKWSLVCVCGGKSSSFLPVSAAPSRALHQ